MQSLWQSLPLHCRPPARAPAARPSPLDNGPLLSHARMHAGRPRTAAAATTAAAAAAALAPSCASGQAHAAAVAAVSLALAAGGGAAGGPAMPDQLQLLRLFATAVAPVLKVAMLCGVGAYASLKVLLAHRAWRCLGCVCVEGGLMGHGGRGGGGEGRASRARDVRTGLCMGARTCVHATARHHR